jgi:hypothetical protein
MEISPVELANKQLGEFWDAFLSRHLVPAQEQQLLDYRRSRYNVVNLPVSNDLLCIRAIACLLLGG